MAYLWHNNARASKNRQIGAGHHYRTVVPVCLQLPCFVYIDNCSCVSPITLFCIVICCFVSKRNLAMSENKSLYLEIRYTCNFPFFRSILEYLHTHQNLPVSPCYCHYSIALFPGNVWPGNKATTGTFGCN